MRRQLYALFTMQDGQQRYFYVGKSHNPARRLKQHTAAASAGRHEDVYDRIRELHAQGEAWHMQILRIIADGDHEQDAERFQVIRFVREGHILMNMRHGSREVQEEAARQMADLSIRSAADVRRDREQMTDGRRRTSQRFRQEVRRREIAALLVNGVSNLADDKVLPTMIRRRLLANANCGIVRIPPGGGMPDRDGVPSGATLESLVKLARVRPREWAELRAAARRVGLRGF